MEASRLAARVTAVLVGSLAVVVLGAGSASAHHADVVAVADCSGTVGYALSAWEGVPNTPAAPSANERSRTVDDVRLEVSSDGGPFLPLVQNLSLSKGNRWAVTGRARLPGGALPSRLVVRAVPVSPFANGAHGGVRTGPTIDLAACRHIRTGVATPPSTAKAGGGGGHATLPGDRQPLVLTGGLVGALATWLLSRSRR